MSDFVIDTIIVAGCAVFVIGGVLIDTFFPRITAMIMLALAALGVVMTVVVIFNAESLGRRRCLAGLP